jgi:hypothetical protein
VSSLAIDDGRMALSTGCCEAPDWRAQARQWGPELNIGGGYFRADAKARSVFISVANAMHVSLILIGCQKHQSVLSPVLALRSQV